MTDFQQIYETNQGFIYKFLLNYCRDASLAEELTQETFFKAYMNFPSLHCQEKAPAWLCQIAKNTYFAWFNHQKRFRSLDDSAIFAPENPEEITVQRELSAAAIKCLSALDQPYKDVFMLSVFGGLPLKEISQLFGKSEGWARVTFYRAKQKILEKMRENNAL